MLTLLYASVAGTAMQKRCQSCRDFLLSCWLRRACVDSICSCGHMFLNHLSPKRIPGIHQEPPAGKSFGLATLMRHAEVPSYSRESRRS